MDKKPLIIAIVLMLVIFIGLWAGRAYYYTRPQVSKAESSTLLVEYKKNIESSYKELNANYKSLDKETQSQEWEDFSREWMQKQVYVRPMTLDKRLPGSYADEKDLLMAAQNELLPLWTEYNKVFTEKKINEEKIQQLKQRIEKILQDTKD